MEHQLPELPYSKTALQPHISSETLEFHHGKHHKAYVTKLNELIKGTEFENKSLDEIIKKAQGPVFNNAAQHWNHSFFWNCMSPQGGGTPTGQIAELINKKFGNFDKFKEEFSKLAVGNFGSGWTWIVKGSNGDIELINTGNADNPMKHGKKALLTLDVWEHAYYIDYRNARPDFVKAFWNLTNWNFVNQNLNQEFTVTGRPQDRSEGQMSAH